MWVEITEKEYANKRADLKPIESFSDPDGILPYGYGVPAMDTIWGNDEGLVLKHEMRKENRYQQKWDVKFFENK